MATSVDVGLRLLGLSHHTAPVAVRERFALGVEDRGAELRWLLHEAGAREVMILSTCNRVEVYLEAGDRADAVLDRWVSERRGVGSSFAPHLYRRSGVDAVRHLFRVAASLDALVVGEPQILGQVKEAVRAAQGAGSLGPVLHRLSQRALFVAKQVRAQTDIGRYTVGVGNAGVELAKQIFGDLRGRRALLVGAGEMGRQVAAAMVGAGLSELVVANRTFATAVEVAQAYGGTPIAYERLGAYLDHVDVVLAATSALQPLIGVEDVQRALRARRYKPMLLVDLSVPRNISPDVDRLESAWLFNVDDLGKVVERGLALRASAAAEAERRVADAAVAFDARLGRLEAHAAIGRIVRRGEAIRAAEVSRTERLLVEASPEVREAVDRMTRALVKKLLHAPIAALRAAGEADDADAIASLVTAFGAEPDDTASVAEG
jgi:glutamyl-tRNA reductase